MCDGGSLPWKYLEPFQIGQIPDDLDEYKLTVDNTMKHNACQVYEVVVFRIDDVPAPDKSDF